MLKKIFLITSLVIFLWSILLSDRALSGLVESRLNNLEYDFYRLESQVNRIESQLSRIGSPSPKTPNNPTLSQRNSRRVSPRERDKMFDRLATLVIELKQDIKDLQKRIEQLEK